MKITRLLPCFLLAASLGAEDIPAPLMAKIVKSLSQLVNSPLKVACKNAQVAAELKKAGVKLDDAATFVFASSVSDVKAAREKKKLIACDQLDLLRSGAAIAVVEEDGKPCIYIHTRHLNDSGTKLPPQVLTAFYQIVKN